MSLFLSARNNIYIYIYIYEPLQSDPTHIQYTNNHITQHLLDNYTSNPVKQQSHTN